MKTLALILFALALTQVILSATAPCVSRSSIIQRGQNWVDKKVPYSQTKTYDGYRTDCSGFVSMCWGLSKPGLSTTGLGSQTTRITKDNLLKGDALIYPSVHVVLFVEWADAKKNSYVGM